MGSQQILILGVSLVLLVGLMIVPQWQARRRQQKQMAALKVGDEVMTVGGIIGRITEMQAQENRARLEIAPGVEIRILLGAISRPLPPPDQP